jgi:hypothetical protein
MRPDPLETETVEGLRRTMLFVPGGNEKLLTKGLGLGVDCLILDLEDSVALDRKDLAREAGSLRSSLFLTDSNTCGVWETVSRARRIETPGPYCPGDEPGLGRSTGLWGGAWL